jgi:hypothetical protein
MRQGPGHSAQQEIDQVLDQQGPIEALVELAVEFRRRLADFHLGKLFQEVVHA